jgi:hypothetical protein
MTILERLRSAVTAPARTPSPLAQRPDHDDRVVIFVLLLCPNPSRVPEAIARHTTDPTLLPVFVTTLPDIRPFMAAGAIVEHLPDPAQVARFTARHGGPTIWADYLDIRWQRLEQKWQPHWMISYGESVRSYLKQTRFPAMLDPT